jgi:hypothetical protein
VAHSLALTPFIATTVRASSCWLKTGCPQCTMDGVCGQGADCGCGGNDICKNN